MSKGKTMVTLKEKRGGTEHPFEMEHALNLLRLQAKTGKKGWEISDKNWKFENNEICKRESTSTNKKPEESK